MQRYLLILILFSTITLSGAEDKILLYYFHSDIRCESCTTMESNLKDLIASHFPKKLQSKTLELRIVNIDKPENKRYIKKYQLYMSTLVLSKIKNGSENKFKILDKIWDFDSKEKMYKYLKDELRKY